MIYDRSKTEQSIEVPLLSRQALLDKDGKIYAYELLHHSSPVISKELQNKSQIIKDKINAGLIVDAFLNLGIHQIAGNLPVFIKISDSQLLAEMTKRVLPASQIVMLVGAGFENFEEIVNSLAKDKYKIAVDNINTKNLDLKLLNKASYLKVNVSALTKDSLAKFQKNDKLKLIAENIHNYDHLENAMACGASLYQGQFLTTAKVISGNQFSANRIALMKLLSIMQDPYVEIDDIDEALKFDSTLAFKLLKIVNSAAFSLSMQVSSARDAIIILGLERVKTWVSLIVLSEIDDKPQELLKVTLLRAKMCELIAAQQGKSDVNAYFTAGLFSTLDAILDKPLESLLAEVYLVEDIKSALLKYSGPIGKVLKNVIAYQTGDWTELSNINNLVIRDAYVESITWTENAHQQLAM